MMTPYDPPPANFPALDVPFPIPASKPHNPPKPPNSLSLFLFLGSMNG